MAPAVIVAGPCLRDRSPCGGFVGIRVSGCEGCLRLGAFGAGLRGRGADASPPVWVLALGIGFIFLLSSFRDGFCYTLTINNRCYKLSWRYHDEQATRILCWS